MKYFDLSDRIINIFYKIYNSLGYGFLEKVYENSMIIELNKNEIEYKNQHQIPVYYEGEIVGNFIADLIIDDKILIELKAISKITKVEGNQLLNYLTATKYEVGLLLNFGKNPEIIRKVYDNDLKKYKNQ